MQERQMVRNCLLFQAFVTPGSDVCLDEIGLYSVDSLLCKERHEVTVND